MWRKFRSSMTSIVQMGSRALVRPFAKEQQPAACRRDVPLDRAQIIESLGVDPQDTPQDSWISIVHNAANSPALRPERLEAMLRARRDQNAGRKRAGQRF